jgi:hypothetical protein
VARWTNPSGRLQLDKSIWTIAAGQIHLDDCSWTNPSGRLQLDKSIWTIAAGQIHLDKSI